jgi:UDP-N-acetyl-D-mannosaminuronic acid dehydrogenase
VSVSERTEYRYDVAIVGGAGHVGLPLAIVLADAGLRVLSYDIDTSALDTVRSGVMPFIEYDAEPLLKKTLADGMLRLSSDPRELGDADVVIIAVGTPIDEYLNPHLRALLDLIAQLRQYLTPAQLLVIRSTVFPGTCRYVLRTLQADGGDWHVAYCPERIMQGYAVRELRELPQIVSGCSPQAATRAVTLFARVSPQIIRVAIEEAELVKLFSNAWRYIQFAAANQFYMLCESAGVDFGRVREAMIAGYGRAATLPGPGFAAGPCLLKDTMQLAAFGNSQFALGQAAMTVNEGLPNFLVEDLRRRRKLDATHVGILGMAFKADIDDIRDSLSYKLGKILRFHGARVSYSDEFAKDPTFISKEALVSSVDVVIVGVPHSAYRALTIPATVEVIDLWSVVPRQEPV